MKPTINEIEIAKKIVNELIDHDFFDAIICRDNENLYSWLNDYKDYLKERNLIVTCGETKACILSNELTDWVIKVGFVDYNEDTKINTVDFCAIEAGNYKDAVEEGLGDFFAASYELCKVTPESFDFDGDVTFYIQERAEPDEDKTSSTCEVYMNSKCSNDEEEDYCDDYIEYDDYDRIESLFGEDKRFFDLYDFINDWKINDLHSGNFGYTKDGRVKIIDYSGY